LERASPAIACDNYHRDKRYYGFLFVDRDTLRHDRKKSSYRFH